MLSSMRVVENHRHISLRVELPQEFLVLFWSHASVFAGFRQGFLIFLSLLIQSKLRIAKLDESLGVGLPPPCHSTLLDSENNIFFIGRSVSHVHIMDQLPVWNNDMS